jgi:hypothetical protein
MKQKIIFAILVLTTSALFHVPALGATPPQKRTFFQLALSHPKQLYPDYWDVHGLRFNLIYGINRDVYGLDTGGYNSTLRDSKGIQLGLFGNEASSVRGVQGSGFLENFVINVDGGQIALGLVGMNSANHMRGFQYANIRNIVHDEGKGIQIAIGNNDAGKMKGVQIGVLLNNFMRLEPERIDEEEGEGTRGDVSGVQVAGVCNYGYSIYGVQFGLINYCVEMSGVQIGLVNVILEGPVKTSPIFNTGFPLFSSIWGEETEEDASDKDKSKE